MQVPRQKEISMTRFILLLVFAAVAVAPAASAQEDQPPLSPRVEHYAQPTTLGFFRGKTVEYLDLGQVKLRAGNKLAPIWAFTNGARGQFNIIDTVPGQKAYSPLWAVRMVTWKSGVTARVLRSRAAVMQAVTAGEATIRAMPAVVNCPVL
jgi:hypothetical protein